MFRYAPLPYYEPEFMELYGPCEDHTMTDISRMYALYRAVLYIVHREIPGDFVECGVWKGGSAMLAALALKSTGHERNLYLYDTFAGMSEPREMDVNWRGLQARERWADEQRDDHNEWCYSPREEVEANMASTGYPADRVKLVEGKVEDTIPGTLPEQIAILRLDTDFYESTGHGLEHLYPLLSPGGVLILDDYGYWQGARQAVDEYFERNPPKLDLGRIDGSAMIGVRPGARVGAET